MTEPPDQPPHSETAEPLFAIYEEDLEEAANDPRARAFLQEAYEKFKRLEAEGRIIY